MKKIKLLLIFLAVLLGIIILKSIFIGLLIFGVLLKYMVLAGVIVFIIYLFNLKRED